MILTIDTINKIKHSASVATKVSSENQVNLWMLVAIFEFLIILWLLSKLKKRNSGLDFQNVSKADLKDLKNQSIDMDNLMNSINKSKELYKELSKKCHPDRFVNTDLQEVADKLFQEITLNQRNYNRLIELKEEAKQKLNINL
jgi:hypothetical protein